MALYNPSENLLSAYPATGTRAWPGGPELDRASYTTGRLDGPAAGKQTRPGGYEQPIHQPTKFPTDYVPKPIDTSIAAGKR